MTEQEREEIIAIILLKKNYAESMVRNMTDAELLKILNEK